MSIQNTDIYHQQKGEILIILRKFCTAYQQSQFAKLDFDTQVKAGWFNWFCPIEELEKRLSKI